jgi:uncharacterized protein (UPF0335 family)
MELRAMADAGGIAADRLKSFIERIERLEEEKAAIAGDIKEVKAEAKSAGFDVPTINMILKRRKLSAEERQEQDALLETYEHAITQLSGTPLGDAGRDRATGRGGDSPPSGGVNRAARDFVDTIQPGSSVTISGGGASTTISKSRDGKVDVVSPPDLPPTTDAVASSVDAVRAMMRRAGTVPA